jgi:hypothetical protein
MRSLPRCLSILLLLAALAGVRPALAQDDGPFPDSGQPSDPDRDPPPSPDPEPPAAKDQPNPEDGVQYDSASSVLASSDQTPLSPPEAGVPLYSMDARRQDAQDLILEFAHKANQPVTMLDNYFSLVTVQFKDLPFERALRRIVRAADLDYVKNDEGYTVGLPIDLKLRFPPVNENPEERIDATYRCRRIDAKTLVKTINALFGEADVKAYEGPEFLTPVVESQSGGSYESGIRALNAVEDKFRTHDVGITGKPAFVRRALAMARKFDRPRKQVRVRVRVMQMTNQLTRNLGVDWMTQLQFTANELPSPTEVLEPYPQNTNLPTQGNGLSVGKFSHNPLQLFATLNALEQTGKTLMVLDGEKAFILSGTRYVYPKIQTKDSTGQSTYDTKEDKTGVYLQVGVQVGLDDDMVLTLYPQVASLSSFQNINGALYPIINTVEEQATVRALKGEVIILGGLKQNVLNDSKDSVPFLGHLPLLGKLFSDDLKASSDQELVFFLYPEIVEDPQYPVEMRLTTRPASAPGQPES